MENYYRTLNVSRYASDDEIRAAYLSALKKYHPDIYQGDKKYAEIVTANLNVAYSVLSCPEKRARYDRSLDTHLLSMNSFVTDNSHYYNFDTYESAHINTSDYERKYSYDEEDFDSLPIFSFFKRSKLGEILRRQKIKLTKEEKRILKEREEKERYSKLKEQVKEAKAQQSIKDWNYTLPEDEKIKREIKNELKEVERDPSKTKLNSTIVFITLLIVLMIAVLVLNLSENF